MIDKELIEQAKRTDVAALIRAKGIELKKTGKGLMGRCPFHGDHTPSLSINTQENYWNCFGCDKGGDAINFVEAFDQVAFEEAVVRLTNGASRLPKVSKNRSGKKPPATPLSVKDKKLLARVAEYYRHSFEQDERGLNYLQKQRNINDLQSIKDFCAGFVPGTLNKILSQDPDVIKQLKEIGILNAKGNETFYKCVVFPLYDGQGAVSGLYGRNIADNATVHLYLAGSRTGLVNRGAVKRSQSIILTESIIDALTLYDRGFKNVIPIYGVNGFTDAHMRLLEKRVKTAYLVFDADEAGRKAAGSVSSRLEEEGIKCYSVTLPEKDVNIYFKSHSAQQFEKLLKQAHPSSGVQSEKRSQDSYNPTDHGFIAQFDGRQYEIRAIGRSGTQLKAVVNASRQVGNTKLPFELTTIDFYSSRSRAFFTRLCADLFESDEALIKQDMGKLLSLVENYKPMVKKETVDEPTKAEKAAAMKLLKSPDMFKQILADFETMGVTGERTNKLVGYLVAVSRKMADPLSVMIQSRSAAGKSTLQDAVLSLVPDEDYVKYTRITDQALFYKEKDAFVHKIIAVEEEAGMGGAAYSIRNMQSAKKITQASTEKDPATGEMRTRDREVNGPAAIMITTTATDPEGETASRFIFLAVNESAEMTEAIHAKQREAETLKGLVRYKKSERIIKKHHTAQRLLKPVAVDNIYVKYLTYPNHSIRMRRDHKKYLGLIRATAFLHQYQRPTKTMDVDGEPLHYIEVTFDDIEMANKLADVVLGQSLDELAPPSRTLLEAVLKMVKAMAEKKKCPVNEVYFTRRQIREHTGWSDWQVRAHIGQLEQLEYLFARIGSKGKEYAYALNYTGQGQDDQRFYLNLTTVEQIKEKMKKDKS